MYVLTLNPCDADVGPERPTSMSPIARRIPHNFDPQGEGGEEDEIVRNLEGITRGVPNYAHFVDVPRAYKRHTVGVPSRIHYLLRWLVWVVTCYHEHHAD